MNAIESELKKFIRSIPDFPKKGILFRDITTLIKDKDAFKLAIDAIYTRYKDKQIDKVVSTEARGFLFGGTLSYLLGSGLIPVRKPGKLPAPTLREEYALEYGTDALEIHRDAIKPGERILVFDDLLATGGTALATCKLVEKLGGKVIEVAFLIELVDLKGREKLKQYKVFSLIKYE
ncbi:adenine phosphoribosyltransferase [candidate division WOR-3 bacterium]|nr:adenine phosphoribosyltransferase [candidate division WOR-3 bacterium]